MKAKRQAVKEWLRSRLTKPIADMMPTHNRELEGHYNYYGVSGNCASIVKFKQYVWFTDYRMFNRRDQKGKMKPESFDRKWNFDMDKPTIRADIRHWNQMVF